MKSGDMVESFGTPAELMGWMAVDGLVRQFAGKPQGPRDERVISDYKVPQRFVVADKLPDTPTWDAGGFDYRSEFKKLWGK
jgi:hypothetical protein